METLNIHSTKTLANGIKIPVLGLGTWKMLAGREVQDAITSALSVGYRHIDTAKIYGNEAGVGQAIKDSGISREQIFITTKLWNEDQDYEQTFQAFNDSLKRLGIDYLDLYLIHWPFSNWETKENQRKQTWQAMEEIYATGKVKAIGVSNFAIKHLEEMKTYAKVLPMVNQFEMHPFYLQPHLLKYCQENNIAVEAYSPLARGEKLDNQVISQIARKYNKSNAQILLRWNLQHGSIVIPKSVNPERIKQNSEIFDFEILPEDMMKLDSLNENKKLSTWDPDLVP